MSRYFTDTFYGLMSKFSEHVSEISSSFFPAPRPLSNYEVILFQNEH
jgi:hypothetical protein